MSKPREPRETSPSAMCHWHNDTELRNSQFRGEAAKMAQLFARNHNHWFQQHSTTLIGHNLAQLLANYLQYLPTLVDDFVMQLEEHRWHSVAHSSQAVIDEYLNQKPVDKFVFLEALGRAYFCHRLIEELHDQLMCQIGQPSIRWNMAMVNVVVHHIIGRVFAEKLDRTAIHFSAKLVSRAPALCPTFIQQGQTTVWPCFCEHHGLGLVNALKLVYQ